MNCMLESARVKLFFEIDSNHCLLLIVVPNKSGHRVIRLFPMALRYLFLMIIAVTYLGSRDFFLQLQQ